MELWGASGIAAHRILYRLTSQSCSGSTNREVEVSTEYTSLYRHSKTTGRKKLGVIRGTHTWEHSPGWCRLSCCGCPFDVDWCTSALASVRPLTAFPNDALINPLWVGGVMTTGDENTPHSSSSVFVSSELMFGHGWKLKIIVSSVLCQVYSVLKRRCGSRIFI